MSETMQCYLADEPVSEAVFNVFSRQLSKSRKLRKENAAQKKQLTELAEAAEVMLELLANNAPIDGLWLSNIDEWDCLIKEVIK